MNLRNRGLIEADEIAFFAKYYANEAYNLAGWNLRMKRDVDSLRRAAGGTQLKRVLSLGCGEGQFEIMLAPFAEQIIALDISPEAIEAAKQKAHVRGVKNVDFRCMPLSDLGWDEQFDTVVCLAFLHHVWEPDIPGLLQQICRHLNNGGFFYSLDPNVHGVLRKIGRVVLGQKYNNYHTPDERELDPQQLISSLRDAGFIDVEIIYIDLTLIPLMFILKKAPAWLFQVLLRIDRMWSSSPFARWASGFSAVARKCK
jgi:SAM-dependent methyltransferase